ncbi:MAG: LLM class F420-dependent oxidoreductase [Caldilinea sp.]
MRLGLMVNYSGANITLPMEMIKEADRLGYYAVWTAEAYGSDAVVPLAWIGAQTQRIKLGTAILQMPARTPANTAMTAMTLDQLSGGRMLLGLGLSGPQVVEGWHGVAYGKPLGKTREYVSIVRTIFARQTPLVHTGDHYQIPYQGADATGLGKPLKSILHGRGDLPIYLAAIGPKNVELTAEIADGWLPIIFSPAHYAESYQAQVEAGFARAGQGKSLAGFDIAPSVPVVLGDDVDACRDSVKPFLALYIGGMGARGRNFYHDLACRYGFQEAADRVQDFYLAGQKDAAAAAIPNELVDAVALCGPKSHIAEKLEAWRASPITTLNMTTFDPAAVRVMAELVLEADAGQPDRTISIPAPAVSPSTPTPADLFVLMAEKIAGTAGLAAKVGASFQFHLTGEQGGSWIVDMKDADEVRAGSIDHADCTITMSDADFVALAQGKLNPMTAFSSGKLKIQGNPMVAMKLQALF